MPTTVTRTVAPSGGDETSLNAALSWFQTNHSNFVSEDIIGEVVIQGDWTGSPDTTAASVASITTDATRYLNIYTATGAARHDGIYGNKATAYRLEVSAGNQALYINNVKFVRVSGLQIKTTSTTTGLDAIAINLGGASDVRIYNNIIVGSYSGSGNFAAGVYQYTTDSTTVVNIWNNIIYDFINGANSNLHGILHEGSGASPGTTNSYNNTIYNCYNGIRQQSGGTCYSYNNGIASCTNVYSGTVSGQTGDDSNTPTFVNEGSDFKLSSADTTWLGQTSDQSSGLFSDDIDYVARPSNWSVGADDYVAPVTHTMTGRYLLEVRSDGTTR